MNLWLAVGLIVYFVIGGSWGAVYATSAYYEIGIVNKRFAAICYFAMLFIWPLSLLATAIQKLIDPD